MHRNSGNVAAYASQLSVNLLASKPFEELVLHEFGAGTHVGNLRDNNEDSFVCDADKELWIVADGMGGLGFGEVASAISTFTVAREVRDGHGINQAIEIAHKKIKEYAQTEANGTNMGTTMVLLLSQGSLYNIFWVGDSRAYLFDDGRIKQLTTDHSLVQSLVEQGEITAEEAISDPRKNVVTRALGVQEMETVRADSVSEKWQPGQKILLCSDGLTDCVRQEKIAEILSKDGSDQDKVDELIQASLDGGGNDNITIILVSASGNAKKSESDTHVPTDVTDSTLVPASEGNALSNQRAHQAQQMQQSLQNRPAGSPPTDHQKSKHPDEKEPLAINKEPLAANLPWWRKNWAAAVIAMIAVLSFARMTTAERHEPENISPAQLLSLNTETSVPLARQGMPNISLPEPGSVLQLGVFSRLEGAETKQQEVSKKGYVPIIEKKIANNVTQYALILGPFYNNVERDAVSSELDRVGISHFERPDSHY